MPNSLPVSLEPLREPQYGKEQLRQAELADEIAELAANLQAADYRLLLLIAEFDASGGWAPQGAVSCAHWLSWRIGLALGAAREKVRVAHALENLPLISEAMSRGEISYSKVRAVTRVATPENEKELLALSLGATASQVEKAVRAWRKIDLQVEKDHAQYQHRKRSVQAYTDEDGMVVIRGRLPADVGAVVIKALQAAAEKLYHAEKKVIPNRLEEESTPRQRKADALKLVAESALHGDLDPGTSADYQVVVHVDETVLREPAAPGQSVLALGEGVSAETSRRIACDSSVVEMKHDKTGNVLEVGRKTRTLPPAIRRDLDARDPTCVWPGCENRFVQGHHIEFWAEGGETKLSNLCNLCYRHHHLVHDGGYQVELASSGKFRFTMPNGREVPDDPSLPSLSADPVGAPLEENRENGLELEGWEGRPKWGYERLDSWTVNVLWSASRVSKRVEAQSSS